MEWLGQHNEADHVNITIYADDNRSAKYQLHDTGATIIGNRTGIFVFRGQTVKEMIGSQNQTKPVEPSLTNTTLDIRATAVGVKNGDTHRTVVLSESAQIP